MARYTGIHCPVCDKAFTDTDSIVVCPICGAPYHRECYEKEGKCLFDDLHKNRKAWTPPQEKYSESHVPFKCPNCGTPNPPSGIFCQVCGARLNENSQSGPAGQNGPGNPFGAGVNGPFPIPPNPFTTPYGGVAADEEIDGVPAKDLVLFVGENSHYFLPKFRDMKRQTRRFTFNWPAFFFNGFYLMYRKMYLVGIIFLLLSLLLYVPSVIFTVSYTIWGMAETYGEQLPQLMQFASGINEQFLQQWATVSTVTRVLGFGVSLFLGFYANRLYMNHVFHKIRLIRESDAGRDETEYAAQLSTQGRTNRKLIVGLLIAGFVFYFVSTFILMFLL